VGERVARLVRVQTREAGLFATAPQDLPDAIGSERPGSAEPQPRQGGVLVAGADPEVAVQGDGINSGRRERRLPLTLSSMVEP
jgi:hypothetical protein